ncbi:MAG: hypothetical protein Q9226_002742 [Calogaya cf. arnoldii]
MEEDPTPKLVYDDKRGVLLSVSLPDSDNLSLQSEPLHELAIIREHGRWAISLITEYLNKQHGHHYTGPQIVRIYRQLRYEQEIAESVHAGQVLVVWREEFRNAASDSSQKQVLKEIKEVIMNRFHEIMESELDDSEFSIDIELDRAADKPLPRAKRTAADTELFSHEDKPHFLKSYQQDKTPEQTTAEGIEQVAKKDAYKAGLSEWEKSFYGGDKEARKEMPRADNNKYKVPLTMA